MQFRAQFFNLFRSCLFSENRRGWIAWYDASQKKYQHGYAKKRDNGLKQAIRNDFLDIHLLFPVTGDGPPLGLRRALGLGDYDSARRQLSLIATI